MHEILAQVNKLPQADDLFSMWQKELELRTTARTAPSFPPDIKIDTVEELDFLLRSLYFTKHRYDFFRILFENLNHLAVLKWLLKKPRWLWQDFLGFLPWHITINPIEPAKMQFIINLYNHELADDLQPVINSLNLEGCRYLLSRTASSGLRNRLREKEKNLLEDRKQHHYGILEELHPAAQLPTIFGDRKTILAGAVDLLQKGALSNFRDPYSSERFVILLQACDLVFQSGAVIDSYGMVRELYEEYLEKNHLVTIIEDVKIYKSLDKLLRKIIPLYILLQYQPQPYETARRLYFEIFARINPDISSLKYLNLLSSIHEGFNMQTGHIAIELLYKCRQIYEHRPTETCLLTQEEMENGLSASRVIDLLKNCQEKLASLPHEAFIVMELIRLLMKLELIKSNSDISTVLLENYIKLWKWVPGRLFINQKLLEQLAPRVKAGVRSEAEQILKTMQNYTLDKLKSDLSNRPDLFGKKDRSFRRELFLSYYLGGYNG